MPKYKDCRGFITAFGSSVPTNRIPQEQIGDFMKRHMDLEKKDKRWIDVLVKKSGIAYRHSVIADYAAGLADFQFYPPHEALSPFPSTGRRLQYYQSQAVSLASEAAVTCLQNGKIAATDITHLIVVSCTGMYAPGLDVDLIGTLGLRSSTARTSISFMGCYAAFTAMKVASSIVESNPDANVLIVCVELCTIHFQREGRESSHVLTNMLFGDGASAALISGKPYGRNALLLHNFACDLFPEGKDDMSWIVGDFGFSMKLTRHVSEILKQGVRPLFERLVADSGFDKTSVNHYAFHPGGPRVLEALEEALSIPKTANRFAYQVLRNYGNMSSATLFFILEQVLEQQAFSDGDLLLTAAFGPGLTCESALMSCVTA